MKDGPRRESGPDKPVPPLKANHMTGALNVLVVEDDATIGMLLAELLETMGHRVCAIESTEAGAVESAARFKPDLMIVDALLGEGSGLSAFETIQSWRPVPHVFVSGNLAGVRMRGPHAIGLQKPYSEPQLAEAIKRALAPGA